MKITRPDKIFISLFSSFIDLIYPELCIMCKRSLNDGEHTLCAQCWNDLPAYVPEIDIVDELKQKLQVPIYIAKISALWQFDENVQMIIHRLKYKHHKALARQIAKQMIEKIRLEQTDNKIDLLIPVPLHRKRKRRRGYNQSTLICNALSRISHIPTDEQSLKRIRNTASQTKLDIYQRIKNVSGAFQVIKKEKIASKTIILVDDVITTGSTINACAEQLMLNGAKEVFALSAARA